MRALALALVLFAPAGAQQNKVPPVVSEKSQTAAPKEQEPPEEDASSAPKEYAFNPLQATKEVKVGDFYFKKRNYRAAANRFREATHWNPNLADAYLRLAESHEKLGEDKEARTAYGKYLELSPDAKDAEAIRKKLSGK